MPTGTTSNFNLTRNELIELALSAIGVTEPSNAEMDLSIKVLNLIIRHLDARGTWLWSINNTESTLTLVSNQQEYSTGVAATNISSNILTLEWAAVLSGGDREQLTILTKPESLRTTLKDDSNSQPIAVYLKREVDRANNKMIFYPTPNSAYTVVYNFRRPLFDFDLSTDNPDVPQDWFLPLQKMLSYELAPHYGKPLSERQLLKEDMEITLRESEKFNSDPPSYQPLKTDYF